MDVPFATLSIHKFISSVGADAGFAAFIGVAIMALLYFAQARETSTLRQRLDEAHDRIGGLEARTAQLMHLQSARQPSAAQPARVTPPPATAGPMGSAIASVRRIPTAAAPAAPAALGARNAGSAPAAPLGMGAPALASATKLIPDLVSNVALASDDAIQAPGSAATAANGNGEAPTTAAATAAAGARRGAGQAGPPRMQMRPEGSAAGPIPRRPASGAPPVPVRPTGARKAPGRPRGEERFDVFDREPRGLRGLLRGRGMPLAIAAAAIVVILVGVIVISGNGSGTPSSNVAQNTGGSTAKTTKQGSQTGSTHHATPPFVASSVKVAVLNGTSVGHLAADVASKLTGQGYKRGNVTNGASQTESKTIVYYASARFKTAANHVAGALKLSLADVRAVNATVLKACATTPAGAATACVGNVIVSVGQDRANLASSSPSAG